MENASDFAVLAGFGLVVGVIAKLIMPGKDPGGLITTALLGLAGSIVGRWAGEYIGLGDYSGLTAMSFASALVGALVLLFSYRLVRILI